MDLATIYLPIYFIAYLAAAFVWPTWRTWRQTGINPITFGKSDNAHDFVGLQMKVFTALLAIDVSIYAFAPSLYPYFLPIGYLKHEVVYWIGFGLMHASLLWIVIAQIQMGNSWRIGIDEANRTELRSHGLFGISRNPIFLGMLASVLGLFLVLPNALSAICLVASWLLIQVQVRLEEEFLERVHGVAYHQYCQKVRRWI